MQTRSASVPQPWRRTDAPPRYGSRTGSLVVATQEGWPRFTRAGVDQRPHATHGMVRGQVRLEHLVDLRVLVLVLDLPAAELHAHVRALTPFGVARLLVLAAAEA